MKNALRRPLAVAAAAATAVTGTALLGPTATAAPKNPTAEQASSSAFRQAVTVDGIVEHLEAFQAIADRNARQRAAGSPGYESSVDHIVEQLRAAGYEPRIDEFEFVYNADRTPPALRLGGTSYDDSAISMSFSPNGDVTAPLAVPTGAQTGCAPADFAGFPAGTIAVISRGGCTFALKAQNAAAAGALGTIVYNNTTGPLNGTLGGVQTFQGPVVGVPASLGSTLVAAAGQTATLRVDRVNETRTTENVIADLVPPGAQKGSDVIVVGAHLDSVPAGPGINDNGSGSATILEMAQELARGTGKLQNTVRFAWWGAEEFGLLGSEAYVEELKAEAPAELARIKLNLNFDMVASPNYGRFIYDGDNSFFPVGPGAAAGPEGSGEIERIFQDAFREMGLASAATPFSGRSDYGPFIAEGIPAGGLFTGAEGVKTPAQAEVFGGVAGQAFDPCYHQLCDNLTGSDRGSRDFTGFGNLRGNINLTGLDEMSDAAATALHVLARRDLDKQPLVDPAPRQENVDGINEGGGLHADHDDHEPVAS